MGFRFAFGIGLGTGDGSGTLGSSLTGTDEAVSAPSDRARTTLNLDFGFSPVNCACAAAVDLLSVCVGAGVLVATLNKLSMSTISAFTGVSSTGTTGICSSLPSASVTESILLSVTSRDSSIALPTFVLELVP